MKCGAQYLEAPIESPHLSKLCSFLPPSVILMVLYDPITYNVAVIGQTSPGARCRFFSWVFESRFVGSSWLTQRSPFHLSQFEARVTGHV